MKRSWPFMIFLTRAPALITVATVIGLTLPPQTADMLAGLSESFWPSAAFCFATLFLCFNLWHWSRAALSARFELRDTDADRHARTTTLSARHHETISLRPLNLLPRFYFGACAVAGVGEALLSDQWLVASILAAMSVVLYGVLQKRASFEKGIWVFQQFLPTSAKPPPACPVNIFSYLRETTMRLLRYSPWGPYPAGAGLVLAILGFLWGALGIFIPDTGLWVAFPELVGRHFPGPSAALLFLGFITGPLTLLTFLFVECGKNPKVIFFRLPVRWTPVLVLLGSIICLTPVAVRLHAVRIADPKNAMAVDDRPELDAYLRQWAANCVSPDATSIHPIIVAVSGGAARAGLWSARVLIAVDEAVANSQQRNASIFAISSVSGGSVGAATYLAMRKDTSGNVCSLPGQLASEVLRRRDEAVRESLRKDALGPLLAGALFGDTPRALLGGFELLSGQRTLPRGGDRAEALERAFENSWSGAIDELSKIKGLPRQSTSFDQSFLSLYFDARKQVSNVPLWLANGTDSQNGERLITSPFRLNPDTFLGAKDVLALLQSDIPISTAIDNTARFPYLSPDGELQPLFKVEDEKPTQIIDGGYFENEGMETALELAHYLQTTKALDGKYKIEPIIVEATADADKGVKDSQIVRCGSVFKDDPKRSDGGDRPSQLFAPLSGLYSVRAGHSGLSLRRARAEFCQRGQTGDAPARDQAFFHFYLYRPDGEDVPLNWVLSKHIANYIWLQALHNCANHSELAALKRVLDPHR